MRMTLIGGLGGRVSVHAAASWREYDESGAKNKPPSCRFFSRCRLKPLMIAKDETAQENLESGSKLILGWF